MAATKSALHLSPLRLLLTTLALALAMASAGTTPPAVWPLDPPPDKFSVARAMADVRVVASRPHVTGTEDNARVRAFLMQRMRQLGLEVTTQQGLLGPASLARHNQWTGATASEVPLVNLIGVLPGRDRRLPAVLLMAHHDTVWGSPGAADDTAGVAATLEVIRAIRVDGVPPRDIIVLFTDAEELGLEGARQFWSGHPLRQHVGVVINMEARGGGGRTTMFQTSSGNGEAARLYARSVRYPSTSSLAAFVYSVLPNDTDLTEVLKGSAIGYNFAFIGRPELYHSPMATPDRLDEGALQDMGYQVLDLTRGLLRAPHLPARSPDVVFFDIFGKNVVTYPTWVGWILLMMAGAGLGWVVRRDGPHGLIVGVGRMVGFLILAPLVLYALNRASIGFAPVNYYDRLAAIPRLEAMALLGSAAAAFVLFGRTAATRTVQVGAALPLMAIGIAAQCLAPTAAYIVAVPLLLAALSLHLPLKEVQMVLGALITGYMLSLGHQLMQGVGPTLPAAASLPAALAVMGLLPVTPVINRSRELAAGCLLLAAAIALWVQLDAPAETRAVYSDHKK